MKRLLSFFVILVVGISFASAQKQEQAKNVLDKASAWLTSGAGVRGSFSVSGKLGKMSGSIAVKGNKFSAVTANTIVWFDGKTQWTYMKKSQEVNVTNPSASQLQSINPYRFINLYKSGYKLSMKNVSGGYEIHLVACTRQPLSQLYVTISSSYKLKQVRMLQSGGWTTINVSNLSKANLSDNQFRFNSKEYPDAEIIDLR